MLLEKVRKNENLFAVSMLCTMDNNDQKVSLFATVAISIWSLSSFYRFFTLSYFTVCLPICSPDSITLWAILPVNLCFWTAAACWTCLAVLVTCPSVFLLVWDLQRAHESVQLDGRGVRPIARSAHAPEECSTNWKRWPRQSRFVGNVGWDIYTIV